jgi:hypothetical protein
MHSSLFESSGLYQVSFHSASNKLVQKCHINNFLRGNPEMNANCQIE